MGSTVTFGATSVTSTLHASALRPLISMASEPQMPCAHERRKRERAVVVPLHLVQHVDAGGRGGRRASVNSSHQRSSETSGL